jgi:hypothetical protein
MPMGTNTLKERKTTKEKEKKANSFYFPNLSSPLFVFRKNNQNFVTGRRVHIGLHQLSCHYFSNISS